MGETGTAKLFRNGRSQAVRLPRDFRFEGDRVRVRRGSRRGSAGDLGHGHAPVVR